MTLRFTEDEYKNFISTHAKKTKNNTRNKNNQEALLNNNLSEKEIQNNIRDYLSINGWFVIRHQQSLGSLKGLSDLSAIKDGKTIYIEVKTPRGHQSDYQKEFQDNIESHGGLYILARSIDDVKEKI